MAEIQPNWENIYKPQANLIVQGNPALDMLRQKYTQAQQDRAANIKDFTGELAKLNFNGARDPDLPELQKDYGNILQSFQKYRTENDPKKQAELNLQMRQMQNQFLYKAQQSKQANDEFHKDAELAHKPGIDLDNSYWDNMKARMKASTFSPDYDKYTANRENWIIPKVDLPTVQKKLLSSSETPLSPYTKVDKIGGFSVLNQYEGKKLNEDKINENTTNEYRTNRGFKHFIDENFGGDPSKYAKVLVDQTKDDYGYKPKKIADKGPDMSEEQFENWQRRWDYENKHPHPTASERDNTNAPVEPLGTTQLPYATDSENGGFNINVRNFTPVKSSDVAFGASPEIDMTTGGKPKGLSPLTKFTIAAVGDVPIYDNGVKIENGTRDVSGTPIGPEYENKSKGMFHHKRMVVLEAEDPDDKTKTKNYLMSYDKIPLNVKNQKAFKSAIAGFEKTPVYDSQGQNKSYKTADVKQPNQGGTITYTDSDGTVYNIPSNKAKAFEMSHPKAKKS
jgi:Sec-independent protein translocase protein TatA